VEGSPLTSGLAEAVRRFVDDLTPAVVELGAAVPTIREQALEGDVALEAYQIASSMIDADGLHTDNEILAMVESFGARLPTQLGHATPGEIRTAGLFSGTRKWVDAPSSMFQLLVDADRKHGTRHANAYYERAMAIAHEVCSTDAHVSHLELASLERLRSTLLAPLQQAPATTGGPAAKEAAPSEPELPPMRPIEELFAELDALVGLAPVKGEIKMVADLVAVQKLRAERKLPVADTSRHLVFTGNPGTGKTTVARLLAQIYRTLGVVSKGHLIETDRAGMVAGFIGQTATKVDEVVQSALGGILLIDEAYSLARGDDRDFGQEAIDALVKRMEDHRDDLVVIVAGYPAEMAMFIDSNPGLRSRFPKSVHFPDYTTDELVAIFKGMCEKNGYTADDAAITAVRGRIDRIDRGKGFGNGRLVRNLFEATIGVQASRVVKIKDITDEQLVALTAADVDAAPEPEAAIL
jgi:Holliday junction resolvasome RuvABC ATP-dependent DNA helicase subunit